MRETLCSRPFQAYGQQVGNSLQHRTRHTGALDRQAGDRLGTEINRGDAPKRLRIGERGAVQCRVAEPVLEPLNVSRTRPMKFSRPPIVQNRRAQLEYLLQLAGKLRGKRVVAADQ